MLIDRFPGARITLVDREPVREWPANVDVVTADGIAWLLENLTPSAPVSKIIPAVPLHLAAYWLLGKFSATASPMKFQDIPDSLIDQFPHPYRTADGSAALSYANFMCPPDCPEPDAVCTHTGLPRPMPLFEYLDTIETGVLRKLIVQSRQFAPGVGGFFPADLHRLLDQARAFSGQPILAATACKCHGIASVLYPTDVDQQ